LIPSLQVFRKSGHEDNALGRYQEQAEVQSVAAFMAQEFNRALSSVGIRGHVKYVMCTTFHVALKVGRGDLKLQLAEGG